MKFFSDYLTSDGDMALDELENFSNMFYPDLYCGCVEASEKACFEQNILELWGDQVSVNIMCFKRVFSLRLFINPIHA